MSATPAVSIITPAYNASASLAETVASVLAQTFKDFELLIVDDGSTDRTLELARQWERADDRIRLLSRTNAGSAAARNAAMRHARGGFFAFLDSDDVWQPGFLAAQMAVFDRFPDAAVVTSNAYNLGGAFDGRPLQPVDGGTRRVSLLDMLQQEDLICIMSVFRREVFERTGGLEDALGHNEDYDFWLRAAIAGCGFVLNPEPLAYYRRRPASKSTDEVGMLEGIVRVLRRTRPLCVDRPAELAAIDRQIRRFESAALFASAKAHLTRGEFGAATVDFAALSRARNDWSSRLFAGMSRHMPQLLLWAYRMRVAVRTRRARRTPPPARAARA
jgi:glycosyltransferase involved in cell wall biosynthesis